MKTTIALIAISLVLSACSAKPDKPANPFSKEEQEQYVNTLSLYLQADSSLIAERNRFFQLLLRHMDAEETDSAYYMENIAHVDSVIHKAIGLVERGNADDLLSLLEKERNNIYAHPCNTIDNEIALHNMLIQLYNKTYKENTDEYYSKIIDLAEYSKLHILGLLDNEQYIPYYIHNQTSLVGLYMCANRHADAIKTGKELCKFTKDKDNGIHIRCVLLLGSLYKELNMTEQQDCCINSVKHLPEFKAIYDDYMQQ